MKKRPQILFIWLGSIFVGVLALAIAVNHFVRVTYSPSRSIGIAEHLLFERPLTEVFGRGLMSDDFRRWDDSVKASLEVADLIKRYGVQELLSNSDDEPFRRKAEQLSETAYSAASAIPKEYLAHSNPNLPDVFFRHFVPAMHHWHQGFAKRDIGAVGQGISDYNAFLVWMQSSKRTDFKKLR